MPDHARPEITRTPLLEAVELACFRGDRLLFQGLNVRLDSGELVQVHGPNGSGKTTLLRTLCGLTLPTEGEIRWRGERVSPGSPEYLEQVHYVGHASGIKLELTPTENLHVARALAMCPTGEPIRAVLARLALEKFHDVPVRTLSAGQRRRVALARLLATQARLWILDEPFTSLDATGVRLMDEVLQSHVAAGGSALMTSHHPLPLSGGPPRLIELGT